jgi:hypothetical protein
MAKAKAKSKAKPKAKPKKTASKAKPKKAKPAARKAKPAAKKAKPAAKKAKPAAKKAKQAKKAKPRAASKPSKPSKASIQWSTLEELSAAWNEKGRAYFTDYSQRLEKLYAGDTDVDLDLEDPRTEEDGDAVVNAIIELNAKGEWARARELFDPAYSPVFEWIKSNDSQLGFVTILGPDQLLVRNGSPWQKDGTMYFLDGGKATEVRDAIGATRSRNRDHLVLARSTGLTWHDPRAGIAGITREPLATLPWPGMDILRPQGLDEAQQAAWSTDETSFDVEQMQVSDDGTRVVVSCYRQGILLASRRPGDPPWQLLMPTALAPYYEADEDSVDAPSCGDMTHVAISRDGTRLAWGSQDSRHFTAEIGDDGVPTWYATVGHISEYPHFAAFSDDGGHVAFNSCHFYNGATIAFEWEGNRGKDLESYEVHGEAPVIEDNLRVYAGCWLPKDVLDAVMQRSVDSPGAFALAGSGILRCMNTKGQLGFVQGFGSSASSMDFCPESRRFAVAGYSGFVHLYDPYEEEHTGRIDGVRARREVARWAFWPRLPNGPIRW